MKAILLISAFVAIAPTSRADEKKPAEVFATHVVGLPPCDRVEVIRLGRSRSFEESEVSEEHKQSHIQTWPDSEWCEVAGKATVEGADAERLAVLFRAFQQYVHPEGVGWSICHFPPYAYRFYSGEKIVGEASVCWKCHNLLISPEGKKQLLYFKEEPKEVQQLLEASNKLFPEKAAK